MTVGARVLSLVWVLLVTAQCASAPRSLSDRFITRGTPAMDLGGPPVPRPAPTRAFVPVRAAVPPPAAAGPASLPAPTVAAASLEATSPRLRRALSALALAPTAERHLTVAQAYLAEGVRDRAFDYLAAGLARDDRNAALHDATARLWRDWGMPDRALRAAHTAVYFAPRSAEARNTLGTVLWALGQRAAARQAFAEATALAPDAWYAWHNLCQTELAAGDTRAATAHCQRATHVKKVAKGTPP